jgi:hypothetical protein
MQVGAAGKGAKAVAGRRRRDSRRRMSSNSRDGMAPVCVMVFLGWSRAVRQSIRPAVAGINTTMASELCILITINQDPVIAAIHCD